MPFQLGIKEAVLDWGLVVHEVPGWQSAGSPVFLPRGHVCHHDVIPDQPGDNDRMPSIIRDGRPDLAGPLANFWLEPDGDVHLCAAGKANHAGEGGWMGLRENAEVWGTEANNGGTPATPWPDEQLEAWYRLCAATCEFSGFPAGMVCGHKEWALPRGRKSDPHTIDMADFRRKVAAQTKGGLFMPGEAEAIVKAIHREGKLARINNSKQHALDRKQQARLAKDKPAEKAADEDIANADRELVAVDDGD